MRIQQRMQSHPILFLLCCVLALATAAFPNDNCILGCKCEDGQKIFDCDSPLVLTKQTLANISKKITTIKFQNLYIKRIEKDAFEEFNDLQNIVIENSNVGSIDSLTFDLHELKTLKFAKSPFGEIPSFRTNSLLELIFDDCSLSKVPNLIELPALTLLDLSNNKITKIDETAFGKLSVIEIRLSNNSISELPFNLFQNNTDLVELKLDHNPIKSIRLNLTSELEILSLKNCKLLNFDRNASENLTTVSELYLSGNELEILPIDAFESMNELQILDLSNNKLVELDDDIFSKNPNLETVFLSNNPLDTLPYFQSKASEWTVFACKNCSLTSIHTFENYQISALENLVSLQTIDLSDNKIENIDGAFSEMHSLKKLILSNNHLKSLGVDSFAKNASLDTLDLSNNPLSALDPVAFGTIQYVKKLNMTNSSLTTLWANHNAILPKLEQLYLGNNNITTISVDDVKVMPELKVLSLSNNPLVCDKTFKELIHFLKFKNVSQKDKLTHDDFSIIDQYDPIIPISQWNEMLGSVCGIDAIEEESVTASTAKQQNEIDEYSIDDIDDDDNDDEDEETIDDNDIDDLDDEDEEYDDDGMVLESISDGNISLRRAYYILSISAVFILTALVVLILAVAVTLLILKKNKSFNMHTGNLPRLKIPLWHTTPGQKKHSGSVYRPLSEDLSGSRTPIINRYEFKQNPQVHNSLP